MSTFDEARIGGEVTSLGLSGGIGKNGGVCQPGLGKFFVLDCDWRRGID